jgi:hypothetical protein
MSKNTASKRKLQILNKLVKNPIKIIDNGSMDEQIAELDRVLCVSDKNTKRLANKKTKNGYVIYKKTTLADKVWDVLRKKFKS